MEWCESVSGDGEPGVTCCLAGVHSGTESWETETDDHHCTAPSPQPIFTRALPPATLHYTATQHNIVLIIITENISF